MSDKLFIVLFCSWPVAPSIRDSAKPIIPFKGVLFYIQKLTGATEDRYEKKEELNIPYLSSCDVLAKN